MHKAALACCGLDGDYRLLDVEEEALPDVVRTLPEQGFSGLNVTIPHKRAIFELAANCTQEALQAGAVNCMKYAESDTSSFEGHNTDIGGLKEALRELGELYCWERNPCTACLLGAGGASRAALAVLKDLGYKSATVAVRNKDKAAFWLEDLHSRQDLKNGISVDLVSFDQLARSLTQTSAGGKFDLVINCTPMGQREPSLPMWCNDLTAILDQKGIFYDMVYTRDASDTPLAALFRAAGARVSDGKMMLVHQARLAFQYWTGFDVPAHVFHDAAF